MERGYNSTKSELNAFLSGNMRSETTLFSPDGSREVSKSPRVAIVNSPVARGTQGGKDFLASLPEGVPTEWSSTVPFSAEIRSTE